MVFGHLNAPDTPKECPLVGTTQLDLGFKKDVNWFLVYLPRTNSLFKLPQDNREPVELFWMPVSLELELYVIQKLITRCCYPGMFYRLSA